MSMGFKDPVLQLTATFKVMKYKQFVQILYREGNHWITVSTMGCSASWYSECFELATLK